MSTYRHKLLKKTYVGLLENVYLKKRDAMIYGTVLDFRKHQLNSKCFQLLKIHSLNQKKKAILARVGDEFRQERLESNTAYINGNSDKVLMQKVYTGWLQYILDKFIGDKVLKKFQ